MRSTPCGRRGSCAARSSLRGAYFAATRGATEGSTPSDDHAPARLLAADAARAWAAPRPQLAARHRRPAVGVVDRRADGDRPDDPRAADGEADSLDAEPAALRA